MGSKGNETRNISAASKQTELQPEHGQGCSLLRAASSFMSENRGHALTCQHSHSPEDCDPHTVLTLKLKMIVIYGHVRSWASDGTMFAQQHVLKGKHQGKILFLKKHVKSTISERRS